MWLNDKFMRECDTWGIERDGVHYEIQVDEVAFGQSKKIRGHRGRRVRKRGIQWYMSMVLVNTDTGKVESFFLEKIPGNRRTLDQLEYHVRKLAGPGATVVTDCHKSYQRIGTIRCACACVRACVDYAAFLPAPPRVCVRVRA